MDATPDVPLLRIFSNIPLADLVRTVPLVCRRWHRLSRSVPDIRLTFGGSKVSKEGVRKHLRGSLERFTNITHINLDGCTFMRDADVAQIVAKTPRLQGVSLQALLITDLALLSLATHCPRLVRIDVGYTGITDRGLQILVSKCARLEEICVPMCINLTDRLADILVGVHRLKALDIGTCRRLTDTFAQRFAANRMALTRLKVNGLRRITDGGAAEMVASVGTTIRSVEMSGSAEVGDMSAVALSQSTTWLTELNMASSRALTDGGAIALARGCTHLTHLDLSHCYTITVASAEAVMGQCEHLETALFEACFGIDDTAMTRPIPIGCRRLRTVSLRGCYRVVGPLVTAMVSGCPELECVDVAGCMLASPAKLFALASGLSNLRVFVYCRDDPVSIPVRP